VELSTALLIVGFQIVVPPVTTTLYYYYYCYYYYYYSHNVVDGLLKDEHLTATVRRHGACVCGVQ
jgi:hypothetical protein